ncbi:hypothetical protein C8J56DRAFT_1029613, partial [Mycena floridula]
MAESPKLRVAIIGAGLGGLTSAVALKECADKLELDIYEATGEISGAPLALKRAFPTHLAQKLEQGSPFGLAFGMRSMKWVLDLVLNNLSLATPIKQEVTLYLSVSLKNRPSRRSTEIAFEYRKGDQTDGFSFLNLYMNGDNTAIRRLH